MKVINTLFLIDHKGVKYTVTWSPTKERTKDGRWPLRKVTVIPSNGANGLQWLTAFNINQSNSFDLIRKYLKAIK